MSARCIRGPRFTISLKRSTQNSSAIHNTPADYPIFTPESRHMWFQLAANLTKAPVSLPFELAISSRIEK